MTQIKLDALSDRTATVHVEAHADGPRGATRASLTVAFVARGHGRTVQEWLDIDVADVHMRALIDGLREAADAMERTFAAARGETAGV